jgi:hypothetical protein
MNTAAWIAAAGAVAGIAVAGCSNPATPATNPSSATTRPVSASTQPAAPAAAVKTWTAKAITGGLRAQHLPITTVQVVTATSDPNHLLGRPGGYTSKTTFADSRITGQSGTGVSAGGEVEVFATNAQAVARARYIQRLEQAAPLLGTEYDYVVGPALLRVSGILTPAEAAKYKVALAAVTGGHVSEVSSG